MAVATFADFAGIQIVTLGLWARCRCEALPSDRPWAQYMITETTARYCDPACKIQNAAYEPYVRIARNMRRQPLFNTVVMLVRKLPYYFLGRVSVDCTMQVIILSLHVNVPNLHAALHLLPPDIHKLKDIASTMMDMFLEGSHYAHCRTDYTCSCCSCVRQKPHMVSATPSPLPDITHKWIATVLDRMQLNPGPVGTFCVPVVPARAVPDEVSWAVQCAATEDRGSFLFYNEFDCAFRFGDCDMTHANTRCGYSRLIILDHMSKSFIEKTLLPCLCPPTRLPSSAHPLVVIASKTCLSKWKYMLQNTCRSIVTVTTLASFQETANCMVEPDCYLFDLHVASRMSVEYRRLGPARPTCCIAMDCPPDLLLRWMDTIGPSGRFIVLLAYAAHGYHHMSAHLNQVIDAADVDTMDAFAMISMQEMYSCITRSVGDGYCNVTTHDLLFTRREKNILYYGQYASEPSLPNPRMLHNTSKLPPELRDTVVPCSHCGAHIHTQVSDHCVADTVARLLCITCGTAHAAAAPPGAVTYSEATIWANLSTASLARAFRALIETPVPAFAGQQCYLVYYRDKTPYEAAHAFQAIALACHPAVNVIYVPSDEHDVLAAVMSVAKKTQRTYILWNVCSSASLREYNLASIVGCVVVINRNMPSGYKWPELADNCPIWFLEQEHGLGASPDEFCVPFQSLSPDDRQLIEDIEGHYAMADATAEQPTPYYTSSHRLERAVHSFTA